MVQKMQTERGRGGGSGGGGGGAIERGERVIEYSSAKVKQPLQ